MSFALTNNAFGEERARRYKAAMDLCPTARYLEVLPLFSLCATPAVEQWKVVDLGSGSGYLADFFEGIAREVVRVDKSVDQLRAGGHENVIVSDMCNVVRTVGREQADLLTCLASFHHVHVPEIPNSEQVLAGTARPWTPERHLDVAGSEALHASALREWCEVLKPGGWLILMDVPGYPDPAWEPFWPTRQPYDLNTRAYHDHILRRLADWPITIDLDVLARFMGQANLGTFWEHDPHLAHLRQVVDREWTLADLVRSYGLSPQIHKSSGPMVPADFFDDIVDVYGSQRHFGYFPRETSVAQVFAQAGMEHIFAATLPTPWVFPDKQTAAWFVHELFGLGLAWDRAAIPERELRSLLKAMERYLGFYEDAYGRTMMYWQLGYFVARKPAT